MPLLNLRKSLDESANHKTHSDRVGAERDELGRNGTDPGTRRKPVASSGVAAASAAESGSASGAELVWNRNLTWEQREKSARQRRSEGLLSFGGLTSAGADASWSARAAAQQEKSATEAETASATPFFATCMNPNCQTNWLRMWRRRQVPRLEGQWACSPECMQTFVEAAVSRELTGDMPWGVQSHRHRMPIGLILLSQGWITEEQLRTALDAQRTVNKGRLGNWLMRQCNVPEERVTRALAMQWGCPIFPVANHQPESVATLIPRLLLDSFGILPVRVASGRILYLGFEDRIDAAAALAISRMTGLRVETGIVPSAQYLRVHERMMGAAFPKAVLTESDTTAGAAEIMTAAIERVRPHDARVVRLHQYLWLRMWRTPVGRVPATKASDRWTGATTGPAAGALPVPRIHQVEDVLCRYVQPEEDAR